MADDLKARQKAGELVESRMLFFLLQYGPAASLTVGDVKLIAERARAIAFDEFSSMGTGTQ